MSFKQKPINNKEAVHVINVSNINQFGSKNLLIQQNLSAMIHKTVKKLSKECN